MRSKLDFRSSKIHFPVSCYLENNVFLMLYQRNTEKYILYSKHLNNQTTKKLFSNLIRVNFLHKRRSHFNFLSALKDKKIRLFCFVFVCVCFCFCLFLFLFVFVCLFVCFCFCFCFCLWCAIWRHRTNAYIVIWTSIFIIFRFTYFIQNERENE